MKLFVLGTLFTVAVTIASGAMQGLLSNRWGVPDLHRQAGAKLESFPEKFANWEMQKTEKLDKDALSQLEPYGYFQRVYVNRKSGAAVNVILLLGPSGPISVHTPEVCYVSRDHEQLGERQKVAVPEKSGDDSIWKTTFRLSGVDAHLQNIYYAWNAGDHWIAAENPRFSFATRPYLYKIQLTSYVPAESSKENDAAPDPAIQFVTDFFPALQKYMYKPSSR